MRIKLSQEVGRSVAASSSSRVGFDVSVSGTSLKSSGSLWASSDVSTLMIADRGIVNRSVSAGISAVAIIPRPALRFLRSTILKDELKAVPGWEVNQFRKFADAFSKSGESIFPACGVGISKSSCSVSASKSQGAAQPWVVRRLFTWRQYSPLILWRRIPEVTYGYQRLLQWQIVRSSMRLI